MMELCVSIVLLLNFCILKTAGVSGIPSCGSINILSTRIAVTLGGPAVYVCPLNGTASGSVTSGGLVLNPNTACDFSSKDVAIDTVGCLDASGALSVTNTSAICGPTSPVSISCSNGQSTTSITINCTNPGIYLTSGSNFTATAGTIFSTIHAWIAYGISPNSLIVYEGTPGSYVISDSFAVDYDFDTCQVLKSQYPPLQLTLRLAGSNPTTLGSLVGEHVIVVNGSNAGVSYLSPPIHLYVHNGTTVPSSSGSSSLSLASIIGLGVGIPGAALIVAVMVLLVVSGMLRWRSLHNKVVEIEVNANRIADEIAKNQLHDDDDVMKIHMELQNKKDELQISGPS